MIALIQITEDALNEIARYARLESEDVSEAIDDFLSLPPHGRRDAESLSYGLMLDARRNELARESRMRMRHPYFCVTVELRIEALPGKPAAATVGVAIGVA